MFTALPVFSDQINVLLERIRDFFQKHLQILPILNFWTVYFLHFLHGHEEKEVLEMYYS